MGTGRRIVLSFSFLVIVTGAFIVGFPWESERFALSEEEDRTVSISKKAYDRLAWAKKEGETLSDVVIRLTSMTLEGLGIVTERDILKKVTSTGKDPNSVNLGAIMSSPLITIDSKRSLGDATALMLERKIRRLLVVDDGKIMGIFTQRDLQREVFNVFGALSQISTSI